MYNIIGNVGILSISGNANVSGNIGGTSSSNDHRLIARGDSSR